MSFSDFMARQCGKPEGLFGRLLMVLYLNRANKAGNQLVFDTLHVEADSRVLEVGFGGGNLLFQIARKLKSGSIDGIEFSEAMLDKGQARLKKLGAESTVRLHQGNIENLPFKDEIFDQVCSVNTVYFWPDLNLGLAELSRAMKSGAHLVLGYGCEQSMREAGYEDKGFKLYNCEQIAAAFSRNGLVPDQLNIMHRNKGGPFYAYRAVKS